MATANIINAICDGLKTRCAAVNGATGGYVNTIATAERCVAGNWISKVRPLASVWFGGLVSNVGEPAGYYRTHGSFYVDLLINATTGIEPVDLERAALSFAEDVVRAVGLDYQLAGALVSGWMWAENIEPIIQGAGETSNVIGARVTFNATWEWSA